MENEILKIVGQAGIGGIALGVFLILFRDIIQKKMSTKLSIHQSFVIIILFLILVWSIGIAGIGAWLISLHLKPNNEKNSLLPIITSEVSSSNINAIENKLLNSPAIGSQSIITEVVGDACMGDDKPRKETKHQAMADAKRKAAEAVITFIKSETKSKDFQLEKDILNAYSQAEVRVINSKELGWTKDNLSGDCFKVWIKAEVVPDNKIINRISKSKSYVDDPSVPLNIIIWTENKKYLVGQKIKIYLKGNKPFFAKVIYENATGALKQILPNPYRDSNYFNGGVIYEIPSGEDHFELKVSPPCGRENILVYASTSQLGDIDLTPAGGVYLVDTKPNEIGVKIRSIDIEIQQKTGLSLGNTSFSEFTEALTALETTMN